MESVIKGYTIRKVTGGKTIEIIGHPDVETSIVDSSGAEQDSFDLDGLRAYVTELNEALLLAERVDKFNLYGERS